MHVKDIKYIQNFCLITSDKWENNIKQDIFHVDGTILAFDWRDLRTPRKLWEVGITVEIPTQHLLNTSPQCYSYVNPSPLLKQTVYEDVG
jgi:hypothetical protein